MNKHELEQYSIEDLVALRNHLLRSIAPFYDPNLRNPDSTEEQRQIMREGVKNIDDYFLNIAIEISK